MVFIVALFLFITVSAVPPSNDNLLCDQSIWVSSSGNFNFDQAACSVTEADTTSDIFGRTTFNIDPTAQYPITYTLTGQIQGSSYYSPSDFSIIIVRGSVYYYYPGVQFSSGGGACYSGIGRITNNGLTAYDYPTTFDDGSRISDKIQCGADIKLMVEIDSATATTYRYYINDEYVGEYPFGQYYTSPITKFGISASAGTFTGSAAVYSKSNSNTNIAKFYLHCDNQFWAHVSYDGGNNWETIASGDDWTQLNKFEVANPTSQTLVDIWCQDNGGIGGFIATMSYNGIEYPTTNPFSAGHWEILGSTASPPFSTGLTAVAPSSLVYNAKGSGAWGSHINSPHISSQAYWVWDGQVNNVLYFRVNFGRIIGNLVPINDPPTDFIKYDGPNDAIFSFNISQSALIGIGSLILVLIIVNVVMICIHWNSKNKQKGYHKVKYMDTDTEAELA